MLRDEPSFPFQTFSAVRQGYVLGSALFTAFANAGQLSVRRVCINFQSEGNIFDLYRLKAKSDSVKPQQLQDAITCSNSACTDSGLKMNAGKTKILALSEAVIQWLM